MGRKVLFAATAAVAMIVLSACSESPKPAAKEATEAKPEAAAAPEAVPAFKAYYEMYKPARTWATDLLALNVKDGEVPNLKNEGGKAGMWTAIFVSPSRKEARTFTWAAADSGNFKKGITIGDKQVWGGATPTSKAFVNSEFAVNSDAAFKVAAEKAAEWLKAHPGVKYTMTLGNTSRFPAPVWYIMWGNAKDGYAVYVNATTGEVVTR